MSINKPPSEATLARVAELRAMGCTWEAVGTELNRPAETVRRWPRKYPAQWLVAFQIAERRVVAEAEGESLLILRQLLRADDPKIRWHAARSLVHVRLELAKLDLKAAAQHASASTTSDAQRLVALLESHSDEQLAELATNELRPIETPLSPNPPGPEGSTG